MRMKSTHPPCFLEPQDLICSFQKLRLANGRDFNVVVQPAQSQDLIRLFDTSDLVLALEFDIFIPPAKSHCLPTLQTNALHHVIGGEPANVFAFALARWKVWRWNACMGEQVSSGPRTDRMFAGSMGYRRYLTFRKCLALAD